MTSAAPRIVDFHHHILPPFYLKRAERWLNENAAGFSDIRKWTPERSIEAMDKAGIDLAVTSLSAPGFAFGDGEEGVSALARRCNDYAAQMALDYPGRFRFFAALPMPDTAASLEEISYALDQLGAIGVGLMSNYDERYLGDAGFYPIFEELNRRGALVFVHPTNVKCTSHLLQELPSAMIEFPVDTGRTIASLLWSGTLSRFPRIRFIFPHGGGVMPMLAERVAKLATFRPEMASRVPDGAANTLARLYVDVASVANAPAIAAIRSWLPENQLLYGSDYPWGLPERSVTELSRLGLSSEFLTKLQEENPRALLESAS